MQNTWTVPCPKEAAGFWKPGDITFVLPGCRLNFQLICCGGESPVCWDTARTGLEKMLTSEARACISYLWGFNSLKGSYHHYMYSLA